VLAQTIFKLLDESIVPAAILIAAKVLGLILANSFYSLTYTVQVGGSILPWTIVYNSAAEAQLANTFSNTIMMAVVLLGFGIVLFRAHFLHSTHIPPKLTGQLTKLKLEHFILDTFEIYHQVMVWLSFTWITTIVIFIYSISGGSVSLGLISFLFSFTATYIYTKDIEIELKAQRLVREGI